MPQPENIEVLVRALDAQRATLGDAAIDFAIAAIREASHRKRKASEPKLRQVTILFCDIVNSTAMLQSLSAEDALQILSAPLEAFADAIGKAGGKVLRFTGDGLLAAFGAEVSREDDAERSVHAALAMLELARRHAERVRGEFGIADFSIRVGINTGPVMLGGGIDADNSAMGHAVHIAARMEQSAPVGALRISHGTWLHVRGLFEMEPQPPLIVKGNSEPLLTYLVRKPVASEFRVVNRGVEGVATPMVGRDAELASLVAIVDEARESGTLRAVTVLGEAGLGKSRLLHEFRHAVATRQVSMAANEVLLFRARPSSMLQPYGALRGMLARRFAITDDASADAARQALVDGLVPLFPERGELQAQLIGRLLGIDFPDSALLGGVSGSELRRRAFLALRTMLASLASTANDRGGVLLILLDDVHWADDGSLDFIESLLGTPFGQPAAVLMLARGELLERRPQWLSAAGAAHRRLTLSPLDVTDSGALADALMQHAREVPGALRTLLVDRTEGNPFYMEELVRMLIDEGVIEVRDGGWHVKADRLAVARVPTTLVGVVEARLEALPASDRRALQQASIIGPVFWVAALAALDPSAPAALARLEARALIHARSTASFEGTTEHRFHHQILHDVTYRTVLKAARQQGHAQTAAWLAERLRDARSREFIGFAAEHYERAGDSAKALEYFDRAAIDAETRHAIDAAIAYNDRALGQPALVDDRWRFEILMRRHAYADRRSLRQAGRDALDAAAAHAAQCRDEGLRDWMRGAVLAIDALEADRSGDIATAFAQAERAVVLAEKRGHPGAAAMAHGELAWLAKGRSDYEACTRHLDAAIPWARRAAAVSKRDGGAIGFESQLMQIRVSMLLDQGRVVDAAAELDRSFELPRASMLIGELNLLERRIRVCLQLGDLDGAHASAERILALAHEGDVARMVPTGLHWLAVVAGRRGDGALQLRYAEDASARARKIGYSQLSMMLLHEAEAREAQGDDAAALSLLTEALDAIKARRGVGTGEDGDRGLAVRALIAAIRLRAGDVSGARADVESVLREVAADTRPAALLTCRHVLHALDGATATNVSRADKLLDDVLAQLDRVLAQVHDAAIRERIVRNDPWWREAVAQRDARKASSVAVIEPAQAAG